MRGTSDGDFLLHSYCSRNRAEQSAAGLDLDKRIRQSGVYVAWQVGADSGVVKWQVGE